MNLYRIAQEALNNITRHAGVYQAFIKLDFLSTLTSMEIIDLGRGFNPSTARPGKGYGLVGMAERASEIGWNLQIESQPGEGTRIHIEENPV